jgi:hypothetical protein
LNEVEKAGMGMASRAKAENTFSEKIVIERYVRELESFNIS